MEGPRSPLESEFNLVLEFLNSELRPHHGWSLASEYPTALNPNNLHNIRIITQSERVLSHAVIKPLIIRSPLAILKIAAIGSVVTVEDHRNQGLSRRILENCLDEARRQDCDLAMLWTNLYDFYRKLDFELAGSEIAILFEQEWTADTTGLRFMKGTQVSPESILRLYSQHTVGSVRTAEDIRKFLQIPQTHCYTAWDAQNQLVAYAIEGKGADLTDYVHEWGGSTAKLTALFSHIRKDLKKPFTAIVPHHSTNLVNQLKKVPGSVFNEGFLGMIKIVQHENFFNKVKKAARSMGIQDFVLERKDGEFVIGVGQDLIQLTDEKDLVKILLGPKVEIPYLQPASVEKLDKFLPLPLWVWGWDSV
jgi:GNAT superfamily N-acetyltransferase